MMDKRLLVALFAPVALLCQRATQTPQRASAPEQLGLAVPMRDGIRLAADLFLPRAGERWPTVLVRTPYSRKSAAMISYRFFARRGYAVLLEDVRGRFASQGTFGSPEQEGPDGNDTINWISAQPWSNGRVAMAGSSYLGISEWWAAVEHNPHLLAISPMCSGDDEYSDRFYSTGGALQIGHRLLWLAENLTPPSHLRPLFGSYIEHLPLRTADVAATGAVLPLWRTALAHPSYDTYWRNLSIRDRISGIHIPILSLGGWFDDYVESDLDAFSHLAKRGEFIETWVGPWAHNPAWRFPTIDFGPRSRIPIRQTQAAWFDRWLREKTPVEKPETRPVLHIFIMGPNVWREEHEWPLARTHYTPLYLRSQGHANTGAGDGILQWQSPKKDHFDTFTYDPKNPVPTAGGAICCEPTILPPGPLDQHAIETRSDVLVYTSPRLTEELEVTGPIRVVLYVSTSANDTDFTAKLIDVQPDGRPLLVTDGIQRLRYRLSLNKPVFVKRNTAYQISIDAGVTSYVFAAEHRIRIEISSSNFPRFDRNLNSARPNADETKFTRARQTVFHEKGYPSAVILPVISGLRRFASATSLRANSQATLRRPELAARLASAPQQ